MGASRLSEIPAPDFRSSSGAANIEGPFERNEGVEEFDENESMQWRLTC